MKISYLSSGLIIATLALGACARHADKVMHTSYEDYPVYTGDDLGLRYTLHRSTFKLWSPPAEAARLRLYNEGLGGDALAEQAMRRSEQGVWTAIFDEDLLGKYYTFQVRIGGVWLAEAPDPYAAAVGVNGRRGMVVDLEATNPEDWTEYRRPPLAAPNDIVIYELHLRDVSMHPNSGIRHQGKYLGLAERGTKGPRGVATGLDHLVEMGVTHVHLLPVFDFRSIDETRLEDNAFNWGYDPQNYNAPEGSYATDPYDGAVRIREFKQMVMALHRAGIRVIMDVVYNHTGDTEASNFNQLVPGYYYRHRPDGSFSDASACGNETASERPMMRKFIVESVLFWAREYHIDGFRFDLMGIHDIETMNQVSAALHAYDPSIFVYGEGWTAGDSPLPEEQRALKKHTYRLERVAAFSDDIRDAIKGHVFTPDDPGFASGKPGLEESIKFGVVAAAAHPQIDYEAVNYSNAPWAGQPAQCITYVSCHDNHTLWDRLSLSRPEASEVERIAMHKLAGAIVLTSQGVAFLHAGVEMLRSKNGEENSYRSPDAINRLDWSRKARHADVVDYYRGLIQLRKNHPAFRMPSAEMIRARLRFLEDIEGPNLVAYLIDGHANGDAWGEILIVFNGRLEPAELAIPAGQWTIAVNDKRVSEKGLGQARGGRLKMPPSSAMVLYR
jgi:pullulanase